MLTPQFPKVGRSDFVNSGGMGSVYADPRNNDYYLKQFNTPLKGEQAEMLLRLIEVQRWARPSEKEILLTRFSWPTEGFGAPDNIIGYSMPKAPRDAYFSLTAAGRTKEVLLQLKYLMDSKYFSGKAISSAKPNVSEQDRLEIAIELVDAIQVVHHHGLVYGDVSSNNMCGRLGDTPSVFLLDADSIVTPDIRAKNPVRTPGWPVPNSLDPVEADRSLISLFVWRFMLEDPNALPNISAIPRFHLSEAKQFVSTLISCYEFGRESDFLELSHGLRLVRDDSRDSRAILRAANSHFARNVIREAVEAKSDADKNIVAKAQSQVVFERLVESSTGTRQRILISRSVHRADGFKLDLSPTITASAPPTTITELREMILDARETELALHLANGDLKNLESETWLPRVIEHAIIEAGFATLSTRNSIESSVIHWTWPAAPYVNYAELRIKLSSGKVLVEEINRDPRKPDSERSLQLKGGGRLQVDLVMGVKSPSQKIYLAADKIRHEVTVLSPPRPTSIALASQQTDDDATIVDLEEEQRLRELAAASAKRAKRNKVLAAAALIVVTTGATVGYTLLPNQKSEDFCNEVSLADLSICSYALNREISTSDFYTISNFGYFVVHKESLKVSEEG
jgi:hypothetical protein